ncbi:MFS transporter [Thalassobacillus hwangdonensis]|uniref:MFS transporter n=1 Tax=Thalassobacillus hwangdonensis TaxID=546108 RepID=A0ABW3KYA2_9BACI
MNKHTLASHNIKLLFWGHLFGNLKFLTPVLTLFYYERGLDASSILIVMLFFSIGVLVGELPTGIFADRYGAKAAFIFGSILAVISHGLLLVAFEPWVFFLSSFLYGFAATFFSGADEALIYESLKMSGEQNLMEKAMGIIQSAGFIITIFVVLIGAFIAKDLSEAQFRLLIILGVCFQSIQVILSFRIINPVTQGTYRENPFLQIKEGLAVIRNNTAVLWMFLNITLVFIPTAAVFEQFDQKLMVDAGLPVAWIGVIYAAGASIAFMTSRSISLITSRINRIHLLKLTGYTGAAGLFIVGMIGDVLPLILFIVLLMRVVKAIRYPVYSQLSNEYFSSKVRATTISLLSMTDSLCDLLLFGSFAGMAAFGFSYMFLAGGIVAIIGAMLPIRQKFN